MNVKISNELIFACPKCNKIFNKNHRPNYCENCGLKLNWNPLDNKEELIKDTLYKLIESDLLTVEEYNRDGFKIYLIVRQCQHEGSKDSVEIIPFLDKNTCLEHLERYNGDKDYSIRELSLLR